MALNSKPTPPKNLIRTLYKILFCDFKVNGNSSHKSTSLCIKVFIAEVCVNTAIL